MSESIHCEYFTKMHLDLCMHVVYVCVYYSNLSYFINTTLTTLKRFNSNQNNEKPPYVFPNTLWI